MPIHRFENFTGMNCGTEPLLLKNEEVELALNFTGSSLLGALTKRKGYTVFGDQMVASQDILGLYNFLPTTIAYHQFLAVVSDGVENGAKSDVYYYDTTWKKILEDDTPDLKTRFVTYLDVVLRMNGTDAAKSWDGNTGQAWLTTGGPLDLGNCPTGKYGAVFVERIYIAGISATPNKIKFSSVPSGDPLAISWTSGHGEITINPEDGAGVIKQLEVNANRLLIFKERAMYRWDTKKTEPDMLIDVGTPSPESVRTTHGITFFLGRSKGALGIYAYSGESSWPKKISKPVKRWLDNMDHTALDDVNAGADDDHYYISIGNITFTNDELFGTRTFTNVVLVYCLSMDTWYTFTRIPARIWAPYVASGVEQLYFGDNDGYVNKFLDSDKDAGEIIQGEIWTKEMFFGFEKISLQNISCAMAKGGGIELYYRMNRSEDWKSRRGFFERFKNFLSLPLAKGQTVQIKIIDESENPSRLEKIYFNYEPEKFLE